MNGDCAGVSRPRTNTSASLRAESPRRCREPLDRDILAAEQFRPVISENNCAEMQAARARGRSVIPSPHGAPRVGLSAPSANRCFRSGDGCGFPVRIEGRFSEVWIGNLFETVTSSSDRVKIGNLFRLLARGGNHHLHVFAIAERHWRGSVVQGLQVSPPTGERHSRIWRQADSPCSMPARRSRPPPQLMPQIAGWTARHLHAQARAVSCARSIFRQNYFAPFMGRIPIPARHPTYETRRPAQLPT